MKIKVYTNRVKIDYKTDFAKAKEYFKAHALDIEFTFEETNLKNLQYYHILLPQGERILLKPVNLLLPVNNADMVIFAFSGAEFTPPNIPTGKCEMFNKPFIDVSTHINNPKDLTYVEICHEIMHGLVYLANSKGYFIRDVMDSYKENFTPYSPTGNFAQQWAYLQLYFKYKYFSDAEVKKWKLKPELWKILDKAREIASTPFVITSGLRTPQENINVGGKANSSHLRGLAVDLLCVDNIKRTMMLKGILNCGTPVFLEVAKKHLHIDIDSSIHSMGSTIVENDD